MAQVLHQRCSYQYDRASTAFYELQELRFSYVRVRRALRPEMIRLAL